MVGTLIEEGLQFSWTAILQVLLTWEPIGFQFPYIENGDVEKVSCKSHTLPNLHDNFHGPCLAHASFSVLQALLRPIGCSCNKDKNTYMKQGQRKAT